MTEIPFIRKHVLPVLRRHLGTVFLSVALLLLTTAGAIFTFELSRQIVSLLVQNAELRSTRWAMDILTAAGIEGQSVQVALIGAFALLSGALVYASMYLRDRGFESLAIFVTKALRDRIYARILDISYLQAIDLAAGTTVKRLTQDTLRVRDLVVEAMLGRVADLLLLIGLFVYLFVLEPVLALGVFAVVAIYFLISLWTARRARSAMRKANDSLEAVVDQAQESLARLIDIRAYGRERFERGRFERQTAVDAEHRRRMVSWLMLDRSVTTYLSWLGPLVILVTGGILASSGYLKIDVLFIFVFVIGLMYSSVNNLTALPMKLQQTRVAIENISRLESLADESGNRAPASTRPTRSAGEEVPLQPLPGEPAVSTKGLEYRYPDSSYRLSLPDFEIGAGTLVAVVGPSGTGKSTFLRLLLGLLDDYRGSLKVFGHEVRERGLTRLRTVAGLMLQDVHLLRATIGENIAYGGLNGVEHSRQDLEAAAQEARLSGDLRHLSGGIDFRVGDEGANLSGGQRRRIALARLFLRNPALMLLDEPLEGVGRGDRQKILEAILAKRSRSTVVIATHDLDIIEAADRILLLERKPGSSGEGVTIGTFGRYRDFQETNEAFKGILGHSRHAREESVTG